MSVVACVGMAVWDRIFSVADLPSGATKLYAHALDETGGGPAATASAAIARLGGTAKMIGRVGADDVGRNIVDELRRFSVDVTGLHIIPGARSAWSAVSVDRAGERLIINFPGEGLDVAPTWLSADLIGDCRAVLVDMGWPVAGGIALRMAAELGIPTVLDADLSFNQHSSGLIAMAEHVLFSAAALRQHTRADDPEQGLLAARLLAPDARVVGVTIGADGCLLLIEDELVRVPGFQVAVVDTLGAGDVFHGAYALAIAEGRDAVEAARFGNAAAAAKCSRKGGRAGVPVRSEVAAFLGP